MVSPLFEEKFGWQNRREALKNGFGEVLELLKIHKDDMEEMESLMAGVVTQKDNSEGKVRIRKSDGAYLWCRIAQYPINDKLGHMTGDQAIKDVAKKLLTIFSSYDLLSRFGGDEYCILIKGIREETLKDKLAWTVEKLRNVYCADQTEVRCSASVGAACTYGRTMELDTLLDCADKALYYAKEHGKDQFCCYSEDMEEESGQ